MDWSGRNYKGWAERGWTRLDWAGLYSSVRKLTQTHGQRLAPGAICLAHGGLVAHNAHVGETAKDDGGAEHRALVDVFQPPVRQVPWMPTVDTCNTPYLILTSVSNTLKPCLKLSCDGVGITEFRKRTLIFIVNHSHLMDSSALGHVLVICIVTFHCFMRPSEGVQLSAAASPVMKPSSCYVQHVQTACPFRQYFHPVMHQMHFICIQGDNILSPPSVLCQSSFFCRTISVYLSDASVSCCVFT